MSTLRFRGLCVALLTLLACGPLATAAQWSRDDAAHLLRRAAFGGTPEQVDALHALGKDAAVEYLISGKLPAGASPVFESVKLTDFQLEDNLPADKTKEARKQAIQDSRRDLNSYRVWWVERMLRTDRPLEEKMTLFWHGLLTSGLQEVKYGNFLIEQNQLFHREALGNYKRLIGEIIHDSAMLRYLDADKNVVGKPNENLARELMELFTMGEGQGYTEKDIAEVARALTGMAVNQDQGAIFRKNRHDGGSKTIFGKTGRFEPDDVAGLIFERPQPPRYLAKRLWEFFGHADPTEEEITPVAMALRQSNFELKPALRALFSSPAFYSEKSKFALIKSPVELTVGTMRLLGQSPIAQPIAQTVGRMGQELFQPPNVRGWPGGEQWITAATLYTRYNFCAGMVDGDLRGSGAVVRDRPNKPTKPQPQKRAPELKKPADGGERIGFRAGPRNLRQMAVRLVGAAVADPAADPKRTPQEMKQERRMERRDQRPADARARDDRPAPISPAALFPKLAANPTAEQVVDAAIERFLQRPLHPEKRKALVESLGGSPLKVGTREADQRIRDMISLVLSTPEYQVH